MAFDVYIGTTQGVWLESDVGVTPTAPKLSSVVVERHDRIRVIFDHEMAFEPNGILHPSNWEIRKGDIGGQLYLVYWVQRVTNTTVLLYVESLEVETFILRVNGDNVRSSQGLAVDPSGDEAPFTGVAPAYNILPENLVALVGTVPGLGAQIQQPGWQQTLTLGTVTMSGNVVRADFPTSMDNDTEMKNLANWSLEPTQGGVEASFTSLVTATGLTTSYIELAVDRELTISEYNLVVVPDRIQKSGMFVESPHNKKAFTAAGIRPTVVRAEAASATTVELTFSEDMDGTVDLTQPNSYSIDGGLTVTKVTRTASDKVLLQLDQEMERDKLYTVTVVG